MNSRDIQIALADKISGLGGTVERFHVIGQDANVAQGVVLWYRALSQPNVEGEWVVHGWYYRASDGEAGLESGDYFHEYNGSDKARQAARQTYTDRGGL